MSLPECASRAVGSDEDRCAIAGLVERAAARVARVRSL
jgi:hypothetical protein